MNIPKIESQAAFRTVSFSEEYFVKKSYVDEWQYFLSQLGITEEDSERISEVSIRVESLSIDEIEEEA